MATLQELEHEVAPLKKWRDSFCLQVSQDMKSLREARPASWVATALTYSQAAQQKITELERRVEKLEGTATEIKRKFGIK